jgi:hypothetical protein
MTTKHAVKRTGGAPLCERAASFPLGATAASRYWMRGVTCETCLTLHADLTTRLQSR